MQKNIVIIIVVILLIGGGVFLFMNNQQSPLTPSSSTNAITSIKDVLQQSQSISCNYTDERGRESKVYIKNGAVRSDYTSSSVEDTGSAIIKNNTMYVWNGKEGFIMELPEASVTPAQGQERVKAEKDAYLADLEKYKQYCKKDTVADSLFTPPADVTFTNYSQMIEETNKMNQNSQYMQQYNNQSQ